MGQKLEKPKEGSLACSVVLEREGRTAVKRINELARVCDINMHRGGRLQAEEWRVLLKGKKGLLSDHGLLPQRKPGTEYRKPSRGRGGQSERQINMDILYMCIINQKVHWGPDGHHPIMASKHRTGNPAPQQPPRLILPSGSAPMYHLLYHPWQLPRTVAILQHPVNPQEDSL